VFRGCGSEEATALVSNQVFFSNVFLSTSKSRDIALTFSLNSYNFTEKFYLIEFYLTNKNTPQMSIDIERAEHQVEKEVLLLPYS